LAFFQEQFQVPFCVPIHISTVFARAFFRLSAFRAQRQGICDKLIYGYLPTSWLPVAPSVAIPPILVYVPVPANAECFFLLIGKIKNQKKKTNKKSRAP